jgi:hypothetical protein
MAQSKSAEGNETKLLAKLVAVDDLKPHPRNYRIHPEDQLQHIIRSIQEHFYRNVVAAREGTILAGHGVVIAARKLGLSKVPVVRLAIDFRAAGWLRPSGSEPGNFSRFALLWLAARKIWDWVLFDTAYLRFHRSGAPLLDLCW